MARGGSRIAWSKPDPGYDDRRLLSWAAHSRQVMIIIASVNVHGTAWCLVLSGGNVGWLPGFALHEL